MTAAALLLRARGAGLTVESAGGWLRVTPASALTPDLRTDLAAHKPEVIAALAVEAGIEVHTDGRPWTPAEAAAEALAERNAIRAADGLPDLPAAPASPSAAMTAAVDLVLDIFPGAVVTSARRLSP